MIYLLMGGRIGNQLFMYAAARTLQHLRGDNEEIVIDDADNIPMNYHNSLEDYDLPGVRYVHNHDMYHSPRFLKQRTIIHMIRRKESKMNFVEKYEFEKKNQAKWNKQGVFFCENGVVPYPDTDAKDIVMWGYFQSEDYFKIYEKEFRDLFSIKDVVANSNYPNLEQLQNRNTVCISIKVQHNVGNEMYDVCNDGYWEEAINYITEKVDNPLFFVCSDNVEFVKEHLIDTTKYDVIAQDASFPVHVSMAVMAQCKHFIIGNTTFGWWAQYLCEYEDKITIAPSRWYGLDIPCEIYQENWHTIEV